MQNINTVGYQMKAKRFYSYSMTPYDYELQNNNISSIPESSILNNKKNTDFMIKREPRISI